MPCPRPKDQEKEQQPYQLVLHTPPPFFPGGSWEGRYLGVNHSPPIWSRCRCAAVCLRYCRSHRASATQQPALRLSNTLPDPEGIGWLLPVCLLGFVAINQWFRVP